jgi:uncharacterized protein YjbI with pentapeptide repeats
MKTFYDLKLQNGKIVRSFGVKGVDLNTKYLILNSVELEDEVFRDSEFRHVYFDFFVFENCKFIDFDFSLIVFENGFFYNCNFENCKFYKVIMNMHAIDYTIFNKCKFDCCLFNGVSWSNVNCQSCTMLDTHFDGTQNAGRVSLKNVDLVSCQFSSSSIQGVDIDDLTRLPKDIQL